MRIRSIALCLGVAVTPGLAPAAHAQYDVTVLQNVGQESLPHAINNAAQSVGYSQTAGNGADAVLWSPSGMATVLQDAGGRGNSFVNGINDAGQSVGYSYTAGGGADAVRWSPSGRATVLQDVGGQGRSFANAINDAGQSVGWSKTASCPRLQECSADAVLWSASGKATVLQDVGGQGFSYPNAVNASGQSVGYSLSASGMDTVLWSPSGKATLLQDVGGPIDNFAYAINASGWSVGDSFVCGGPQGCARNDAVLWSPSGKATVLQDVGGRGFSWVVAINDAGWSVGYSQTAFSPSAAYDAVLWSPAGKATVLKDGSQANAINDAGWSVGLANGDDAMAWSPSGKATDLGAVLGPAWTLTDAVGINNSGDIIGYGHYRGGIYGFLLTPDSALFAAPEPSTWAMMLAGLAGLGFAGYRRERSARQRAAWVAGMSPARPPTLLGPAYLSLVKRIHANYG
jgi:hypothetical protein